MKRTLNRMIAVIVLVTTAAAACANDAPPPPEHVAKPDSIAGDADNARAFVQSFYDWYVALANGSHGESRYDSVLVNKGGLLAPSFLAALREDVSAQHQSPGEIVGPTGEFDVFLASQDPCTRYEAKDVAGSSPHLIVTVHAMCPSSTGTNDPIMVHIERTDRGWLIANIQYRDGSDGDLLSELKQARAFRDSVYQ